MWYVGRYGAEEAMSRLRVGIRRLNESHGTPNSNHEGYHETVTRAYTPLLSKYYASCPAEMSLRERVSHLPRSPLADRDALYVFYSRETLTSVDARASMGGARHRSASPACDSGRTVSLIVELHSTPHISAERFT